MVLISQASWLKCPVELIGHLEQAYITPLQAVNAKQTKLQLFPLFEGIYVSYTAFYF